MNLSAPEIDDLLHKYTCNDAPLVVALLLTDSVAWAQSFGRLSRDADWLRLDPVSPSPHGDCLVFPLRGACFAYADNLPGTPAQRESLKKRFDGIITIVSPTGDRLFILEPR